MLIKLETLYRSMVAASADAATPEKYRLTAARGARRLKRDLDAVYTRYAKLHIFEAHIALKYGITE